MNDWLNIIQKKLLPPRCILCGHHGYTGLDLCEACFKDLPKNIYCCYRCGENFTVAVTAPQICGQCLTKTPYFDDTYAPYLYHGAMRYLISQLKYAKSFKNARLLGKLLARHIAQTAEMPDCIIPMPLHFNRFRQRGFNQSIEVARHVSKTLGIPLDLYSCIRNRDTVHQTGLSAEHRRKNMRGAFALPKQLTYRHVAILDDVMTTGATASTLASVLKEKGVGRVDVWVCARA